MCNNSTDKLLSFCCCLILLHLQPNYSIIFLLRLFRYAKVISVCKDNILTACLCVFTDSWHFLSLNLSIHLSFHSCTRLSYLSIYLSLQLSINKLSGKERKKERKYPCLAGTIYRQFLLSDWVNQMGASQSGMDVSSKSIDTQVSI